MKKLFVAIRQNDIELVKELIEKKPQLIFSVAKQPPKKDDGQSPLQVAIKTGKFEITDYLLSQNADVNFIESENCCNKWRAPVIHDAINSAIMNCRWNVNSEHMGFEVFSTKENADKAFVQLKKIINLGADINAKDSYGNSCLNRACLQARQVLPSYNHQAQTLGNDRIFTDELREDLQRIFRLLIQSGADLEYISPNCGKTVFEQYKNEPVAEFLES